MYDEFIREIEEMKKNSEHTNQYLRGHDDVGETMGEMEQSNDGNNVDWNIKQENKGSNVQVSE